MFAIPRFGKFVFSEGVPKSVHAAFDGRDRSVGNVFPNAENMWISTYTNWIPETSLLFGLSLAHRTENTVAFVVVAVATAAAAAAAAGERRTITNPNRSEKS